MIDTFHAGRTLITIQIYENPSVRKKSVRETAQNITIIIQHTQFKKIISAQYGEYTLLLLQLN